MPYKVGSVNKRFVNFFICKICYTDGICNTVFGFLARIFYQSSNSAQM